MDYILIFSKPSYKTSVYSHYLTLIKYINDEGVLGIKPSPIRNAVAVG